MCEYFGNPADENANASFRLEEGIADLEVVSKVGRAETHRNGLSVFGQPGLVIGPEGRVLENIGMFFAFFYRNMRKKCRCTEEA